jgi:hypothetical protein
VYCKDINRTSDHPGRFKWSSQRLMRSYDDQIEAASLRSFW